MHKIYAPAKINLFLYITGKRPDGYHELATLMCCVGIYDIISFKFNTAKTKITCSDPLIPVNSENSAHKAADIFFDQLNKNNGVEIFIEKHIPTGAGLGGGSSNGAAVLLELNKYYGYPFPLEKLARMALRIGADTPFFIYKTPAVATGIGEKLKPYKELKPYPVIIVFPNFSISTASVYKNLNFGLTKSENKHNYIRFKKYGFDIKQQSFNALESVVLLKHPEIRLLKQKLSDNGASVALMSGSGSAVFGIFPDNATAQNAKNNLPENLQNKVFLANIINCQPFPV